MHKLLATFSALISLGLTRDSHVRSSDVLLAGIAAHKLARILHGDKIAEPFRDRASSYPTLGELVACPYCLSVWTAAGFHVGLRLAPRTTRYIAAIFASVTVADFLQIARQGR